jgi:hypothetical protein
MSTKSESESERFDRRMKWAGAALERAHLAQNEADRESFLLIALTWTQLAEQDVTVTTISPQSGVKTAAE